MRAGTEPAAGAGQHDHPDRRIGLGAVEPGVHPPGGDIGTPPGVQPLGPVQGDDRDAGIGDLIQDRITVRRLTGHRYCIPIGNTFRKPLHAPPLPAENSRHAGLRHDRRFGLERARTRVVTALGVPGQTKSLPPSTLTFAPPVMYELRFDARKAATGPISSGRPARGRCAGWPKCSSMADISR